MFGFFRRRKQADEFLRAAGEAEPEDRGEVAALQACRERFGPPPRSLGPDDAEAFRLALDPELEEAFAADDDKLLRVVEEQDALRDRGLVVWGHLVQANSILFDPDNTGTLPANVLYSTDPFFDGRASVLGRIARGLFAQKGTSGADRELREFVRIITDEYERLLRRELPRGYCGGRSVHFATFLVQPSHLPGNCLRRPVFPLVVSPEETEAVMVLPSRYWPPEVVAQWQA
jgi:hypothetical protein